MNSINVFCNLMFKERLERLIIISAIVVSIISVVLISFSLRRKNSIKEYPDTINIFYIGNIANRGKSLEGMKTIFDLIDWDLTVYGGDTVGTVEESNKVINTGERFSDKKRYFSKSVDGVLNIFLENTEACTFDKKQLVFLESEVNKDEPVKILYIGKSLYANKDFSTKYGFNELSGCDSNYWNKIINPIIDGKIQVVISNDAEGFNVVEHNGIQYVQNSLPKLSSNTNFLQFTRIKISESKLAVNSMSFGDVVNINTESLNALKTFRIQADYKDLKDLYTRVPFYNHVADYAERIASGDEAKEIQKPIKAKLLSQKENHDIEINVRGSLGNHWHNFKKSWDIQITDSEARQLKLILPSDRHYLSQIFAEHINNDLEVLTPHIEIVRLIINDIDMGPYLLYEDFDKAFIELHGYNSNAKTARSLPLSYDWSLSVYENPNYIAKSGNSVDKTYQQKYTYNQKDIEQVNKYFDKDYTAKWIAIQIFSQDGHQNNIDNNRFFLDKATGRYVMVTWDQWYRLIDPEDPLALPPFQEAFFSVPENKVLVMKYLKVLASHENEHKAFLKSLIDRFNPIFLNDPLMIDSENIVMERNMELLTFYDSNIITLQKLFNEEIKK